jgi:hypothetical protein
MYESPQNEDSDTRMVHNDILSFPFQVSLADTKDKTVLF